MNLCGRDSAPRPIRHPPDGLYLVGDPGCMRTQRGSSNSPIPHHLHIRDVCVNSCPSTRVAPVIWIRLNRVDDRGHRAGIGTPAGARMTPTRSGVPCTGNGPARPSQRRCARFSARCRLSAAARLGGHDRSGRIPLPAGRSGAGFDCRPAVQDRLRSANRRAPAKAWRRSRERPLRTGAYISSSCAIQNHPPPCTSPGSERSLNPPFGLCPGRTR